MERLSRILLLVSTLSLAVLSALAGFILAPRPLIGGESSQTGPYFDPPHSYQTIDSDSDGDYDVFQVNASITLASENPVSVDIQTIITQIITTINSSDVNQSIIQVEEGPIFNSSVTINYGTATYVLADDARPFFLSCFNGTWRVDLMMVDSFTGELYSVDTFNTSTLIWSDFDPSEAELTEDSSDYALDIDDDGKMDILIMNITLVVAIAGEYAISGAIYTEHMNIMFSSYDSNLSFYDIGSHAVQLSFNVTCCQSYVGPFPVLVLIQDAAGPANWTIIYDEHIYLTTTESLQE